ncbi:hypothetical protein R5R35_012249 [Gryllus longicercus]|uniref:Uncharacterized protein n=1 Tax=Gryllus longicercus TaxID=2509291 RepID=A0AAN9YV81_9ORTH
MSLNSFVSKLFKLQELEDNNKLAYSPEEVVDQASEKQVDGHPAWMRTLHNSASTWLNLLPCSLQG